LTFTAEQIARFETYLHFLTKWQRSINLVSKQSLNDAWSRHILDSAQLDAVLPAEAGNITDIGSGAGFPGLVLAILRPESKITLIESDARKCAFLTKVSRETSTNVSIINARIEDAMPEDRPDIITARALAPLENLLGYMQILNEQSTGLFLKGERWQEEIERAQMVNDFEYCIHPSALHEQGAIIEIWNIRKQN
jgi:16S rRNA (guanine527-N7)-methyltransferase